MKAVFYMTGSGAASMSSVLDRPYIQHVVEQVVRRGVDVLLIVQEDGKNESVEQLLGDGTRWGISIEYCNRAEMPALLDTLANVRLEGPQLTLWADPCCLPALPERQTEESPWPCLYFHDVNRVSCWSGWAWLPDGSVGEFAAAVAAGETWREAVRAAKLSVRKIFLETASLSVSTAKEVLEANRRAVDKEFTGLYFDGIEREPGIWIGRGAKIPSSATILSPCYIGEETWIGENCRLGPHAVIGRECVIEKDNTIWRSVVGSGTYLGPGLEVTDSIVERNCIHNVRLKTTIDIEEEHVASELTGGAVVPTWVKRLGSAAVVVALVLVGLHFIR